LISIDSGFWIVVTGVLAAGSCALLGAFLVLRKMSLLGDALSHAILPGIAIAFLISESRSIFPMFLGASIFGLLTTILVEAFHRKWRVQEDASIGIVFTAFFALGVVIVTAFAGQVDLDQECVLYGEIAYVPWDILYVNGVPLGPRPVWVLGIVSILNLIFVALFYKELKISSFDPSLAMTLGINATIIHYLLMAAVSFTTVASFESVGAILVVAMMIVPGATAYLWSDRLNVVIILSVVFGVISAPLGYWLATLLDSSIAGAMVVVTGSCFTISLIIAPNQGIVARIWQRFMLSVRVAQDHILLALVRHHERQDNDGVHRIELLKAASVNYVARWSLYRLTKSGLVECQGETCNLAQDGRPEALRLLRNHRLWESYLSELGLPEDHVHGPADTVEHFIDSSLATEIDANIQGKTDPQGKEIPRPGVDD
jgi:manganese/zinc/iron transport system permease protein